MNNRPTPHPSLVELRVQPTPDSPIELAGFVAPSEDGIVRLSFSLSRLDEYLDINQADIIDFRQDEESGATSVIIKSSAVISAVSSRQFAISLLFVNSVYLNDAPDNTADPLQKCINKRIRDCRKDPMRRPGYCNSQAARDHARILCMMFPDRKSSLGGPVTA